MGDEDQTQAQPGEALTGAAGPSEGGLPPTGAEAEPAAEGGEVADNETADGPEGGNAEPGADPSVVADPTGAVAPGGEGQSTGDVLAERREGGDDPALEHPDAPEVATTADSYDDGERAVGRAADGEPQPVGIGVVQDNVSEPGVQTTHTPAGSSSHTEVVQQPVVTTSEVVEADEVADPEVDPEAEAEA